MICLDTQVLIWGVQGQAAPGAQEMIGKTARYISHLKTQGTRVMIPAPVVTEYLQGFDVARQHKQLAALQQNFFIPAFDLPAAALTAQLARGRQQEVRRTSSETRQSIKVDFMIAAIAIIQGASEIVTHNATDFKSICKGRIRVIKVPDVSTQEEIDFS